MKIIKPVFVLIVALLMLTTIVNAASTISLDNYPTPFIKNGFLDNTVFVIGETAASSDVLGGMQIASSLQSEAVTKEVVNEEPTNSIGPSIGVSEGSRVGSAGNFNYRESIRDVNTGYFDSGDLPLVFQKTVFKLNGKEHNVNQRLEFGDTVGTFEFINPEDKSRGDYISIKENQNIYEFSYDLTKGVSYDSSDISRDFKGEKIIIQGNEFHITGAKGNNGVLNEFRLDKKDNVIWLVEGQPYTFGDHIITVLGADSNQQRCMLSVDEISKTIREDKSDVINGLSISVVDIMVRHSIGKRDICQLSLGNFAVTLRDGQPVIVNRATLDGSKVEFIGEAEKWRGFTITYTAGNENNAPNDDDIYLEQGEAWVDPVFGSWKLLFADVTRKDETISFRSSGDVGSLTYKNINSQEVKVPYYYDTNSGDIKLGRSTKKLLLPGDTYNGLPEKIQLLYTPRNGDTRILEITDTSCSGTKSEITILDKTTGNVVVKNKKLQNACDGTEEIIQLSGSLGSVKLVIAPDNVEYVRGTQFGDGTPQTKYKGTVSINNDRVSFTEKVGRNTPASTIRFSLEWNSGGGQIEVTDVTEDGGKIHWITQKGESSNMQVTEKGTKISYQATKLVLEAPKNDVSADVFITPLAATIQTSSSKTITKVNKFDTGVVVLDSEVKDIDKNMIVVGGPCANSIAAEVMKQPFGNPFDCTNGFTEGNAMIKMFEKNGKIVLLVAGYSAEDTLAATQVLSNYNDHLITGREIEVRRSANGQIKVTQKG
jgi:hypothetical protein